jgi:spore coat protein H
VGAWSVGRRVAWLVFALSGVACDETDPPADASEDGGTMLADAEPEQPPSPPPCKPRVEGPADVLEGSALELRFTCESGEPLRGSDLELDALPEGALLSNDEPMLRWTPGLDRAGNYAVTVRVPATDERVELRIGVVDRWDHPDNVPVDPMTYTEELGLPVFHLGVSEDIADDEHRPATLVYRGHSYRDVTAKYRGATSRRYPKRSYTVKFSKDDEFHDVERGFERKRRIVFTSTFDDNSYLRQRLAYRVWNELAPNHVRIEAFNAVVFVDGEYHGLYVVTDHVDDELMEAHGLPESGNLYKSRAHTADYRVTNATGKPKSSVHVGFTKEEGEPPHGEPGAYADLDALITWVDGASDEEFRSEIAERLVLEQFEDWWILVLVTHAIDSAGKNHYLYHDPRPDAPDTRFHYVPWDFNASFGQSYQTRRFSPLKIYDAGSRNRVFERLLADPLLAEPMIERLHEALTSRVAVDKVLALLDTWADEIGAAAQRDEDKWGEEFRDFDWGDRETFNDHVDEIEYVHDWIIEHWAALAATFSTPR